jgi:hypothetical protein
MKNRYTYSNGVGANMQQSDVYNLHEDRETTDKNSNAKNILKRNNVDQVYDQHCNEGKDC